MRKGTPEEVAAQAAADDVLAVRVKKALRQRMAQLRQALPEAARKERSRRVVERIANHPWFVAAGGVALFAPMLERGEIDVHGLDALGRDAGKRIYYPFMDRTEPGFRTGFRQVRQGHELALRGHRFLEPDPSVPDAKPEEIDFIVVPALAAALTGHRIGSGSGFYDVTLPDFPNAKYCVVVFSFQMLAEIPREPHDRPCHLVCSDEEMFEAAST
ncbi:MAG TPA: 5-formyltetrahydrofolate cyclo-ligase [Polyangiaceae bacterium]|nr:5-formyltetrahydrofolate cyclo-ligase [Polyangiaceae bacterium]